MFNYKKYEIKAWDMKLLNKTYKTFEVEALEIEFAIKDFNIAHKNEYLEIVEIKKIEA